MVIRHAWSFRTPVGAGQSVGAASLTPGVTGSALPAVSKADRSPESSIRKTPSSISGSRASAAAAEDQRRALEAATDVTASVKHRVIRRHWTALRRANQRKTRHIHDSSDYWLAPDHSMSTIDPTARIEDGAVIGEGTSIGPYCIIGPHVVIGANCKLIAHVHITAQTTIGDGCTIYPFVSLGTPPQSLSYRGELTRLEIGAGLHHPRAGHHERRHRRRRRHYPGRRPRLFHELQPCRSRLPGRQRRDLRDLGDAGRPLRDRRFRLHRRPVGGASVHPGRAAGDGRRRLRRARRRDSVRPRQRPVCEPRRPQHHRHEAPQVHPRAARHGALVLSKAVSRARHVCRAAQRGAAAGEPRIRRSRKSWPSSARPSIARCACRRTTAARH